MCELFAGDYKATVEEDLVLSTLLGSCIAVCLLDSYNMVAGMNHFMLPSAVRTTNILLEEDARYGVQSMELMINEMMKLGADRKKLKAKVFGGGKVLGNTITGVSDSNIEFAFNFLEMENIPVLAKNVGGDFGRKIYFYPETFDVYVKKIRYNKTLEDAAKREREFLEYMRKQKRMEAEADNLVLFD